MALAGCIAAICSDTMLDSIGMLSDELYLIPLCALYVVAMFFGLLGAKHLDASVVSPLENIDGAIAAIILYIFFLFTNRSHITDSVGAMDMIGAAVITAGGHTRIARARITSPAQAVSLVIWFGPW